jgi:hypothetical protein
VYNKGVMFGKPRYNKEKGVAQCYSSRVIVTKNYREFRLKILMEILFQVVFPIKS